jgi:O-antigen/teichoic acid export membrane protein
LRTVILRLGGFVGFPLLGILIPLLLLPVIARVVGPEGWASIVSAMAIGAFGATAIMWGWNIRGTVLVASTASQKKRAELYGQSLLGRALLAVVALPLVGVITVVVAADEVRVDATAVALATALSAFSPAWFCVGIGSPRFMGIFDTLPRVLSALLAIPLIALSRSVMVYPVLLVLFTVVALVSFRYVQFPRDAGLRPALRDTWREMRRQVGSAGVNVSGSAYASVPVPVATVRGPAALASVYSSADQLYRFGLFTTIALGNTFQGWILEVTGRAQARRHRIAFVSHAVLGVLGASILTALGPPASAILFSPDVAATRGTCALYGVAFIFINLATPLTRNLLIPARKDLYVLFGTLCSSAVGVALMLTLPITGQLTVIAVGVAVSEVLLFLILLPKAMNVFRVLDVLPDEATNRALTDGRR